MDTGSRWKKIRRPGIKLKLVFSYLFIIAVSFGFAAYFLDKNLENHALQGIKSSLVNEAFLIKSQIPYEKLKSQGYPGLQNQIKTLASKIKSRLTVIDHSGVVMADSDVEDNKIAYMENHADRPEVKIAFDGNIGEQIRYSSTLKINMLYVAMPLAWPQGVNAVLRIALPLVHIQQQLREIRRAIIISVLLAVGLAIVLGSILAMGIVKPINKIIHTARKFSSGDFQHKILLDSKDEIGELASVLNNMASDIEEKINEVQVHNQHLSAILHSMVEGIIVLDKTGKILSINIPAENIFNIKKNEAEGRMFLEAIPNNDIADLIGEVSMKKEFVSKELSLVWPVKKFFIVDVSPIFQKEELSGCLVVVHDITEIRRLETMRKDFVANVSHELKTPLTSIKGFLETLIDGAFEDKENASRFLNIILDHANRLDGLINDLLSLSYLESKEIILNRSKVDVSKLVDSTIVTFKSQVKSKSIEIINNIHQDLFLNVDKNKLSQVFTNLIDNAIKFNRENGTVMIYNENLNGQVKIVVEDTGMGIPQKDVVRIFERFYRVDKARSRELGGTGLGLSIVKHIIELHGGSVGVDSTEGIGSKFYFILPQ